MPKARSTRLGTWNRRWAAGSTIAPGETLWLLGGTYKHPDRTLGSPGYVVRLAGREASPIHIRAVPNQRVTIDGGLSVQPSRDMDLDLGPGDPGFRELHDVANARRAGIASGQLRTALGAA